MSSKITTAIVFLGVLILFSPSVSEGALGISPPYFNANYLVPGATYSQTVYLVQDRPDTDLNIRAILDVPEKVRPWISLNTGMDFVIPQGTRQFPIEITIKAPKDSGLGVYNGKLSFETRPVQEGQVTIALGVQVSMNIVIGNDIYRSFAMKLVKILDIEENWNPRVHAQFVNDGNVPEIITGATFELTDQYNNVRLAYAQKAEGFPEIEPFSTKEYTIEFPISFKLGTGQYWGNVNFYQNDKIIGTQKMPFTVVPSGSLSGFNALMGSLLKNVWLYVGLGILIFLIFIIRRLAGRKR